MYFMGSYFRCSLYNGFRDPPGLFGGGGETTEGDAGLQRKGERECKGNVM